VADVSQAQIFAAPLANFTRYVADAVRLQQSGLRHQQDHQNRHKTGRNVQPQFQALRQMRVAEFHPQCDCHHGQGLPGYALGYCVLQGMPRHHHGLLAIAFGNAQCQRKLL
jgi:hypothetical protein